MTNHPQVIISDVNMPGVDDMEMIGRNKQMKGLKAGASDYLTKPFSFHSPSTKTENLLIINSLLKNTYSKHIQLTPPEVEVEEELSKAMFVSRGTLYSKVLNMTGESPVEYMRSLKLKKALLLLQKNEMKRAFKAKYNVSPSEYLAINKNATVE